jgi:hypothetical protein
MGVSSNNKNTPKVNISTAHQSAFIMETTGKTNLKGHFRESIVGVAMVIRPYKRPKLLLINNNHQALAS